MSRRFLELIVLSHIMNQQIQVVALLDCPSLQVIEGCQRPAKPGLVGLLFLSEAQMDEVEK